MASFVKRRFFITIAAILLGIVFSAGLFAVMHRQVISLQASLRDIESKIVLHEEERKEATRSLSLLRERSADIGRIQNFFVEHDQPIEFIEFLERAALESGNAIVLGVDEQKSKQGELYFRMTADGTESSVRSLLSLLEAMPYFTVIDDVSYQFIAADIGGLRKGTTSGGFVARLAVSFRVKTL